MDLYRLIASHSQGISSAIEIGCGEGFNLRHIKCNVKIGIDAFLPILDKYNLQDKVVRMCYDLKHGIPFINNSVDIVFGVDIIEHFKKADALYVIAECERVAKNKVFFFIPVGNHPQTEDDRGLGNDYYQTHRSQWVPEDMEALGYSVIYEAYHFHHADKDQGAMFCWKVRGE